MTERRKKQIQPAFGPEKAFGEALRDIRTEQGFSQERLALEGDFDRTFPSLIERGLRSPSIRTLVRLAAVLNVRPSQIVRRMEILMESRKSLPKAASKRSVTRSGK